MNADRCVCLLDWPQLIRHQEDGFPITIVRHQDRCLIDSVRVSGVHLPAATNTPLDRGSDGPEPDSARWGELRPPARTQKNDTARRLRGAEAVEISSPLPPPSHRGAGKIAITFSPSNRRPMSLFSAQVSVGGVWARK